MATLGKTKDTNRDSYIILDHEKALRSFDEQKPEDVMQRLREVKQALADIFLLPGLNLEPDSIAEKVPTILDMYYEVFKNKDPSIQSFWETVKFNYIRYIKYPTQHFRLTVFGGLVGFFLLVISMGLLYMPSKSAQHIALKRGVAIGNILAIIFLICITIWESVKNSNIFNGAYCNECEAIVQAAGTADGAVDDFFEKIPQITTYLTECHCFTDPTQQLGYFCLACTCLSVYNECVISNGRQILYYALIAFGSALVVATGVFISMFSAMEEYSLSLM